MWNAQVMSSEYHHCPPPKKKKKVVITTFLFYYLFMKICNFISLKIWFLTSKSTCQTTIFFLI